MRPVNLADGDRAKRPISDGDEITSAPMICAKVRCRSSLHTTDCRYAGLCPGHAAVCITCGNRVVGLTELDECTACSRTSLKDAVIRLRHDRRRAMIPLEKRKAALAEKKAAVKGQMAELERTRRANVRKAAAAGARAARAFQKIQGCRNLPMPENIPSVLMRNWSTDIGKGIAEEE